VAKGHYLVIQDKTTCGGIITEGDITHTLFGRAIAREQDRVTCGKHPGTYIIVGHIPGDTVNGRKFAGTLHSFSSCPCKARFIPSMLNDTYELSSATTTAANDNHSQESTVEPPVSSAPADVTLVFAKSFQRGAGNTEAGTADEPQNNFAAMSFYQSQPAVTSPVTNTEPVQHAQAAKRKKPETPPSAPTPKKRSLFDKVSGFFFGEAEAMPLPLAPPPVVSGGAAAEAGMTATAGGATAKANQDAAKALTHSMKRLSGPSVWQGSLDMVLPFMVMGAMAHNMLKGQKSDLLTAEKLLEVANKRGTVPTRVRYNWVEDEQTGRLKAVGYHTSAESGSDQVRVRRLYPTRTGGYEFWEDGAKKPTILWTPDNPGYTAPSDTAHGEQVVLPSGPPGLEIPDIQGVTVTVTPIPEERDFRDYILVFPANEYPPIYIYLNQGRSGIPDKDHDYHPAPETNDIGISGLRQAKKKTPKQGGGGLRERWIDAKGRRIYEWDSQHGELEEYRASDGEHLGSVDYKTGEQLKPAVKGRNIKRYL
jgi:uncharacterized Zn-binding protein involved in type VI secretion